MGAYTNIVDSEVDVIDIPGLEKFLKDLKDKKLEQYINREKRFTNSGENEGPSFAEAVKLRKQGDGKATLDFQGLDGWKIISYWYTPMVTFFRDIAVFVEGTICMEFETPDEAANIDFNDGKCIINSGNMTWTKIKPEEMSKDILPLSEELKSRLVARSV